MSVEGALSGKIASSTGIWRRHASAWSVWTRLAAVPLTALVIYARIWIGWWSLLGLAAVVILMALNVMIFPKEMSDRRWEARAIFGEKFWLERKRRSIPAHHLRVVMLLNIASSLFALPMAFGFLVLDPWATVLGVAGMAGGQIWALDRYGWIYADLTHGKNAEEGKAMVDGAL